MTEIAISAFIGLAWGFFIGLILAIFTRDGVWPHVWLGFIIAGGLTGVFVAAIALTIR
jgi:Mg/Co/Ni transporter MgtE